MATLSPQPVMTNLQVELLKVFAMQLPDEQLREIRFLIARFLMEKVNNHVDKIAEERGYDGAFYEKRATGEIRSLNDY
jgi:hypothetical protein